MVGSTPVVSRALTVLAVGAALTLAACGSSSPSTASAAKPAPVVKTATATVSGKSETILVDAKGMTLYYYKPDSNGKVNCTGSCATIWPPLKLPSGVSKATGGSGVTGTVSTIASPSGGNQVTYDGWPLYTYSGDSAPGQTNGEGKFGRWYVVTPGLATPSGGSNSSNYGY
jgi:predicted lipoprotein with Yx(FWY)xxD motif